VIDFPSIATYVQVAVLNCLLSGDNAVVIGMAAAGLVPSQRTRAIVVGIVLATVVRLAFATLAVQLLAIPGLLLVGGLLLLWVVWRMVSELRGQRHATESQLPGPPGPARKSFRVAIMQIVVADVSMSLDNVLAVAGAARHDMAALIFGLGFSVLLMAVAANAVATLLARYRWLGWLGLAVVAYVALAMIAGGSLELLPIAGPNLLATQ